MPIFGEKAFSALFQSKIFYCNSSVDASGRYLSKIDNDHFLLYGNEGNVSILSLKLEGGGFPENSKRFSAAEMLPETVAGEIFSIYKCDDVVDFSVENKWRTLKTVYLLRQKGQVCVLTLSKVLSNQYRVTHYEQHYLKEYPYFTPEFTTLLVEKGFLAVSYTQKRSIADGNPHGSKPANRNCISVYKKSLKVRYCTYDFPPTPLQPGMPDNPIIQMRSIYLRECPLLLSINRITIITLFSLSRGGKMNVLFSTQNQYQIAEHKIGSTSGKR